MVITSTVDGPITQSGYGQTEVEWSFGHRLAVRYSLYAADEKAISGVGADSHTAPRSFPPD